VQLIDIFAGNDRRTFDHDGTGHDDDCGVCDDCSFDYNRAGRAEGNDGEGNRRSAGVRRLEGP
jgi:hypothetical protein